MKYGSLIVTSHNPWRRRGLPILMALFVVGGGWGMYELGQMQAGYNNFEAIQKHLELSGQIGKLSEENQALREQVTMLERTRVVDREAGDEVHKNLKELQDEILELREEVDFYRGIISPADGQTGLDVQSFKLTTGGEQGLYHYDLVMTQVLRNDQMVNGVVKVFVHGARDGAPLTLDFKHISPNDSVNESFQFRYYQRLAGDIQLPAGFVARTVQVEISSAGRKTVTKSFPWTVQSN